MLFDCEMWGDSNEPIKMTKKKRIDKLLVTVNQCVWEVMLVHNSYCNCYTNIAFLLCQFAICTKIKY